MFFAMMLLFFCSFKFAKMHLIHKGNKRGRWNSTLTCAIQRCFDASFVFSVPQLLTATVGQDPLP